MLITGSCHCRNISFTLECASDLTKMPARACTCSFCTKHGAIWTTLSSASLKISVKQPADLAKYSFETKTAQFHICTVCGVVPVVVSRIEGRLYAVVNVNTFEEVDSSLFQLASANFDGESEEMRLARRKRNWIANVDYAEGGT